MNRLQKKCVIATTGFHLLLLVILIVGPAFFNSKPKVDDTQVLNFVSPDAIEAAINAGVQRDTPPPPNPMVTPPPAQPVPLPPAPKPASSSPSLLDQVKNIFQFEPAKPAPVPPENQTHKIQVDLHPVIHTVPQNPVSNPKPNPQEIKNIADNIRSKLSPPTTVGMPGDGNVARANYDSIVKSVYDLAWTPPDNVAVGNESVKVSVTIASDGTVINARIIAPSGDANLDASVQRTLERVSFVAPFLTGMTEKVWTRTISFNPETKRMSE